jgi:thymidylate synthase (FAD)
MTVELVQSMGGDDAVVRSARVSTTSDTLSDFSMGQREEALINYLMRDRHGSPFEHNAFTFFVEAPIFVFREFMRHRIASYNEESGRYKELSPVFYVPGDDRKLVQVGKPGAYTFEDGDYDQVKNTQAMTRLSSERSYELYKKMLDEGIAREVARVVLPVNIYSSMYVTMNARALMNFLSLRTTREGTHFPSFPQREIEMVAEKMEELFAEKMPITYATFNKNGRVAP